MNVISTCIGRVKGTTSLKLVDGHARKVSEEDRRQICGKTIHEAHLHVYLSAWVASKPRITRAMSVKIHDATPAQAELFLSSFTDRQSRREYLRDHSLAGYELLRLKLKMNDDLGPIQNVRDYNLGGSIDKSVEYALQLMTTQGRIPTLNSTEKLPLLDGPHDTLPPDAWCSPVFGQVKKGRFFPDSDLVLVRPLCDMRMVNAGVDMTHYDLWHVYNPNRDDLILRIPPEAFWFGEIDLADAFHFSLLHEHSRKYMWICFKRKFYQWRGVPQGLAPASLYFQAMIIDLFNHALGLSWQMADISWAVTWCDDIMSMADTRERAQQRQDILVDVLTVAGFVFSPKCQFSISQEGQLIGLTFTQGGNRLSDDAVEALTNTLAPVPVTSTTKVRSIIGTIHYSSSAFQYNDGHGLARHGELCKTILDTITGPRLQWTNDADAARAELRTRIGKAPRKLCDPINMLNDDTCFCIVGDASSKGGGSSIYLVHVGNAADIDPELHLCEPHSILLDLYQKVLSEGEQRWHIFEAETHIIVKSIEK